MPSDILPAIMLLKKWGANVKFFRRAKPSVEITMREAKDGLQKGATPKDPADNEPKPLAAGRRQKTGAPVPPPILPAASLAGQKVKKPLVPGLGEERRATAQGPQIFCVLMDNSVSMEEGSKAGEATKVLREFMGYASRQNGIDSTGEKSYFLTQVVMFAERFEDLTGGIVRPPAVLSPPEKWQVRHPACAARLGNTTNFKDSLECVYAALTGPGGLTQARLAAAIPAPVVLLITDGKPTRPDPEETAREAAMEAAERIKRIVLPSATRMHPTMEELSYAETNVKLITIGLGTGDELDEPFLKEIATMVEYKGKRFPLYLHCPDVSQLKALGTRIVGTMTRADQREAKRLEDLILEVQSSSGTPGR